MTPVDKDDFEDAELARRLAALPQPEPSAELDAAIFAQIQKDLAPGPAAANDPAAEPPRPSLLRRYRAPLAFAASLAGIAILLPVWRTVQRSEAQKVDVQIITEDARLLPSLPASDAEVAAPSATAAPAAPQEYKREAGIVDKSAKPASPVPVEAAPVPPPPPAPATEYSQMPAPKPAPAAPPPQAPAAVFSRAPVPASNREPVPAAPAAVPEYAPPPAPAQTPAAAATTPKAETRVRVSGSSIQVPGAKEWLDSIEHMLDEGQNASAIEQWQRFRKAYPDYPVPDVLAERLKALE